MVKLSIFPRSSTATTKSVAITGRTTSRASNACESCHILKRPCDKSLPSCGHCQDESLKCNYNRKGTSSNDSRTASKASSHPTLEPADYRKPRVELSFSGFPAAYFLDGNVFYRGQLRIPTAELALPQYVRDLIPDAAAVRTIASHFFGTIHTYMPIISKLRFHAVLMNPLLHPRTDVGLLLLCMRMITLPPFGKGPMHKTPEYLAAKEFYAEVEAAGTYSIQVLQAGVLIALYEFGHAIYPQAYFTIGACIRYGVSYGMNDIYMDVYSSGDWVEEEERKRVWWAVLLLDRCVNLGRPTRALLTPEPHPSCVLPMDDVAWDNGKIAPETFTLFSPSTAFMGKYARLAKATYLLGRVFKHACDRATEQEFDDEDANELRRTLRALVNLSEVEDQERKLEDCTEAALCFSGLLILQEYYGPIAVDLMEELRGSDSEIASNGIEKGVVKETARISAGFLPDPEVGICKASPFMLHSLYQVTALSTKIGRQNGSDIAFEQGRTVTEVLKVLDRRWKAAGAYLGILETRNSLYYH